MVFLIYNTFERSNIMADKIIIVGGVAGGASTTARLRRLSEEAEIIMIEKGEYISFANCGLPYHIGGVIKERDALLVQTPLAMMGKFNVDIRTKSEVVAIKREAKKVVVFNHETGEEYEESYDKLVLSTGSTPMKPPIPGIEAPNLFTLWTIPDADDIKKYIRKNRVRNAAVVGGGFIGVEIAENLMELGIDVTLIEKQDQVMNTIDKDMAETLHFEMRKHGMELQLGKGVVSFDYNGRETRVNLDTGEYVDADMVILSIGVRPQNKLATDSGLKVGPRGHVITDDYLQTSDENIYAVGDVIEVVNFVSGEKTAVPLAGPANKQGRIAANNLVRGNSEKYRGTMGTSIAKVFGLTAASTGLSEKALIAKGLVHRKDYNKVLIHGKHHVGYYPGAEPMVLKLLTDMEGKILGASIVGSSGVDKRIDVLATAMRFGGKACDLKELELAYAPPFNGAKDPINMLGFVTSNIITGMTRPIFTEELTEEHLLLDVRNRDELEETGMIKGAVNIPLGALRKRIGELDRSRKIVVYCGIGIRGYIAERILAENGFEEVYNLAGGYETYSTLECQLSNKKCSGYYHKNMEFKHAGLS